MGEGVVGERAPPPVWIENKSCHHPLEVSGGNILNTVPVQQVLYIQSVVPSSQATQCRVDLARFMEGRKANHIFVFKKRYF